MDEDRQRERLNEVLTQFFLTHITFERAACKLQRFDFLGEAKDDLEKARYHLGQLATHIEQILTTEERREVVNG